MSDTPDPTLTRRKFLTRTGGAAAALAAGTLGATDTARGAARGPQRPNVVLILLDDLGYGDLGCYGSGAIRTPNIDRLAAGGLRLTDAYAGAPVCTPSRAALMTGRYGARVGLPRVLFPEDAGGIPDSERTVAEYLRDAGYATGCFGKWHLGSRREYNPTRHGFDRFFGPLHSNDMEPFRLWEDDEVSEARVDQTLLTRRYTEEAARFIRENRERPFFAYLPHTMPHRPLHTEPRFRGLSEAGPYGDVVESVDHYVGSLVETLEDEGLLDDTLIVVTSDNGPWYSGNTGGLRGRKAETYEGGLRVPFVAHWPAGISADRVSEHPVSFVDLLPTLCALAGTEPEPEIKLDGEDVSPVLRGEEPGERRPIYFLDDGKVNAVRDGDWKLHVRRVPAGGYGSDAGVPQLFDLRRDPTESYDLSESRPDVVDELTELLEEFEAEVSRDPVASRPHDEPSWRDWLPEW